VTGVSQSRDRIADDLRRLIRGEVRFGRHDRLLYATDASLYQVEPIGVVIPRDVDEAAAVIEYCGRQGIAVLPRGGGTSLAGQAVAEAVVVDFSVRCRRIEVDPQRRVARVEPGAVLDELNGAAAPHGLLFGPDVATSTHATLGGMIGNNSAGARSILYGRTVDHVEAVEVALADGSRLALQEGAALRDERVAAITRRVADVVAPLADQIRRVYPRIVRRVNGYNLDLLLDDLERSTPGRYERVNLARLLCGAEGTLGAVLRARVRLVEAPRHKGLVILGFESVESALEALRPILATGPAAVELLDDLIIGLAMGNAECRRLVELLPPVRGSRPGAVLYVEQFAADAAELDLRLQASEAAVREAPSRRFTDAAGMARAWALRRSGEPLLHGIHGDRKPVTFVEDAAVDPSRLPEFVREFRRIVAKAGTTAAFYAHASVGCLHIRPMLDVRREEDLAAMAAMAAEVTDLVRTFEGALSGEHGDGRSRTALLRRFYGDEICDAFARIKAIFDPRGIFNPGNIVGSPSMTGELRLRPHGPVVEVPAVRTFFRYDRQGGFGEAVTACNGAGVCRRTGGGTMCPSYRALRDERHATRGRANALRLAITGQLSSPGGTPAWDDPETVRTLDLCLGCKACKAECPSNVDVAKLKAEYTAQGHAAAGGAPWRARLLAGVRAVNRTGSALWPIAGALCAFGPSAWAIKRLIAIDRRRSLPRVGPSLYRWIGRRRRAAPPTGAPAVLLFPDCFSVYSEPRVGRSAVETLEALGYRVVLPRIGCCGRAAISGGLLQSATRTVRATAGALLSVAAETDPVAIVVCEPGCASAILDEWLDLRTGLDEDRLRALADRTQLIEQFIESRWDAHPSPPPCPEELPRRAERLPPRTLLHGHCHQKALLGIESSSALLRRLLGERLSVLDSGCCGMAGSFGYSPDHYELSMAIGELVLFPALRANPGALVLAPGTSCRHQILDGTSRVALHPIELVHRLLGVQPAR
jgi:FAD/FMN-containing dehydrogenase/Fe-S oxidoreductase